MKKSFSLALIALVTLSALLAACGKKVPTDTSSYQKPAGAGAAPTGPNSDAVTAFTDLQKQAQVAKPAPDLKVPPENYTALQDNRLSWLTYLAAAYGDRKSDDKELLNMFSAKFHNEPDAFKKQEMISSELPPIKALLSAYSKQRYYAWRIDNTHPYIESPFSLRKEYNFESKSFAVGEDENCFNHFYTNDQSVNLRFTDVSLTLCNIKIEDLETAKRVEQLRAAGTTHLRETIYFFVQRVEGNDVKVVPTHVRYDIYEGRRNQSDAKLITSVLAHAPSAAR